MSLVTILRELGIASTLTVLLSFSLFSSISHSRFTVHFLPSFFPFPVNFFFLFPPLCLFPAGPFEFGAIARATFFLASFRPFRTPSSGDIPWWRSNTSFVAFNTINANANRIIRSGDGPVIPAVSSSNDDDDDDDDAFCLCRCF